MKAQVVLNLNGNNNAEVITDAGHCTTCITGNNLSTGDDNVSQVTEFKNFVPKVKTIQIQ